MNLFKEAESIACMLEKRRLTQAELASSLGVSPSYIANKLRLLRHSPEMQRRITDGGISERHARALLRLETAEKRDELLTRIISEGLTVERTEALVDSMRSTELPKKIIKSDRADAVNTLINGIKDSVKSLRTLGVYATATESYHGSNVYVTVSINIS